MLADDGASLSIGTTLCLLTKYQLADMQRTSIVMAAASKRKTVGSFAGLAFNMFDLGTGEPIGRNPIF